VGRLAQWRGWFVVPAILGALVMAVLLLGDLDVSANRFIDNDLIFRGVIPSVERLPYDDASGATVWVPANVQIRRSWAEGSLPLWDRHQGGGHSLLGTLQYGALSPLRMALVLVPEDHVGNAMILWPVVLGWIGFIAWMVALGTSAFAGFLGGAICFGSMYMLAFAHLSGPPVFCWLPWVAWACVRFERQQTPGRFGVLVLSQALLLTSGHPLLVYAGCLFLLLWFLARRCFLPIPRKAWLGLLASTLWAFGASALALWPALAASEHMVSYKTFHAFARPYLAQGTWFDLALHLQAMVLHRARFTDLDILLYTALSPVALLLALVGLVSSRTQAEARPLLLLVPVSFLIGVPGPWTAILGRVLPGLALCKHLYVFVLLNFAVALAFAFGAHRILSAIPDDRIAVAGGWVVLLLFGATGLQGRVPFGPTPLRTEARAQRVAELFPQGSDLRVTGLEGQTLAANQAMATGVHDLRLLAPIYHRRFLAFLGAVDEASVTSSFPTLVVTPRFDAPLLARFNLGAFLVGRRPYSISRSAFEGEAIDSSWRRPEQHPPAARGLRVAFENAHFTLLRSPSVFPRAYLSRAWDETEAKGEERRRALLDALAADRELVEVEGDAPPSSASATPPEIRSGASIAAARSNQLRIETHASEPTLLVVNETWDPSWQAWVDGEPAKVHPVNILARGVFLSAGRHTVTMRFRPLGFRTGLLLSLVSVLGLAALLAARWARRKDRSSEG